MLCGTEQGKPCKESHQRELCKERPSRRAAGSTRAVHESRAKQKSLQVGICRVVGLEICKDWFGKRCKEVAGGLSEQCGIAQRAVGGCKEMALSLSLKARSVEVSAQQHQRHEDKPWCHGPVYTRTFSA